MKEVKNPKKPLAYYYSITLIALLLFNIFVAPLLNRQHVEQTDYSTFMRMIAEKKIGKVDVSDTEIIFTDKDDNTIYVTGVMYDPTLTQRLYDSGAEFAKDDFPSCQLLFLFFWNSGKYASHRNALSQETDVSYQILHPSLPEILQSHLL